MFKKTTQYISVGDLIDFFHLFRRKGFSFIVKNISISSKLRTTFKWDKFEVSESDFWILPQMQKRWNYLCSGNTNIEYEQYVASKYLSTKSKLKMLSVGCGYSDHEIAFFKTNCFETVEGIDISQQQLDLARKHCALNNFNKIEFKLHDFETDFLPEKNYDVILFHSSLHHFKNIQNIITQKTIPILKDNGLVIIFEYTGPNRLQWTKEQLEKANQLLKLIPNNLKTLYNSKFIKKRVYRPGLIRTLLTDPSEAAESESILKVLHQHFETLEEKKLGGNILHPLLKGISHHFNSDQPEINQLLENLFKEEENFVAKASSDFTFGVYRKKLQFSHK